ncbi:hypothetical protein [Mesorhizobium sp. M0848]|uniref:hypothetical protein n=1 Tax=Mesorhizobium sp. M0848 TaxID=2957012 RepID=UPI003334CD2E
MSGGYNNALTAYDSFLGEMMGFEADRMFNLILNEDDIKTERNVILEERRWRRETNPQVCWTRRSTRHRRWKS